MNRLKFLAVAAALVLVAGCSGFGKKTEEYKGAAARTVQPLEVPPELTAPTMDDRYSIPDPRAQTAYSAYSQKPVPNAAIEVPAVLPKFDGVKIERFGDQRWLVVKGEPEKVWPVAREFWIDNGFKLLREEPQLGLIETDWHEDRSKIPQDLIRRTIGRFLEGVY
ncbi:MAG TPA: outer membrane protein assembly factor BamC, partial [Usitatibacter sp.]